MLVEVEEPEELGELVTFVTFVELVELVVLGKISDTEMVTVNGGMVSVVVIGGEVEVALLVLVITMMDGESKEAAGDVLRATVFVKSTELEPRRVEVWVVMTPLDEALTPASMETR